MIPKDAISVKQIKDEEYSNTHEKRFFEVNTRQLAPVIISKNLPENNHVVETVKSKYWDKIYGDIRYKLIEIGRGAPQNIQDELSVLIEKLEYYDKDVEKVEI